MEMKSTFLRSSSVVDERSFLFDLVSEVRQKHIILEQNLHKMVLDSYNLNHRPELKHFIYTLWQNMYNNCEVQLHTRRNLAIGCLSERDGGVSSISGTSSTKNTSCESKNFHCFRWLYTYGAVSGSKFKGVNSL